MKSTIKKLSLTAISLLAAAPIGVYAMVEGVATSLKNIWGDNKRLCRDTRTQADKHADCSVSIKRAFKVIKLPLKVTGSVISDADLKFFADFKTNNSDAQIERTFAILLSRAITEYWEKYSSQGVEPSEGCASDTTGEGC